MSHVCENTKAQYVLYNTDLHRPLIHPQVGIWSTEDRTEADALLDEFHNLVRDWGHPEMVPSLVVRKITELDPVEMATTF